MSHVLVVDDSPVDRRLAGSLLERAANYHVEYAANGLDALEHVEARLPLAVVTDLQMPEMDGLALLRALHRQFPGLPVVLMTAHGSEEVALQALLDGAADYVPKGRLATDLGPALGSVLAAAGCGRGHQRLAPYLRHLEFHYELDSDPLLIPPLVEQVQMAAEDLGLVDRGDRVRLAKAVEETLRNAMLHGNLGLSTVELRDAAPDGDFLARRRELPPYRDRRVRMRAALSREEVRLVVQDDGPGFDHRALPDVKADPAHLAAGAGRGLVLIRMFMDEVRFNDAGNEITLVKRRRS